LAQLRLDLRREPEFSRDSFIVSGPNADAVRLLETPERWNGAVLALVGPPGSGKTHLGAAELGAQRAGRVEPQSAAAHGPVRAEVGLARTGGTDQR